MTPASDEKEVEAVARSIAADQFWPDVWPTLTDSEVSDYLSRARAAIAALDAYRAAVRVDEGFACDLAETARTTPDAAYAVVRDYLRAKAASHD